MTVFALQSDFDLKPEVKLMKTQTYLSVDHVETPRLLLLPWRGILMTAGVVAAVLFPAEALVQTLL